MARRSGEAALLLVMAACLQQALQQASYLMASINNALLAW